MDLSLYLCIIPARIGSKRLPKKNFRDFCGKPLWKWSAQAAAMAGMTYGGMSDNILLSTDASPSDMGDNDFMAAEVVDRPKGLAGGDVSTWWVVEHACYTYEHFGPVIVLQPTSPLRTAKQIQDTVREFERMEKVVGGLMMGTTTGGSFNGGVYVAPWKGWEYGNSQRGYECDTGPDIDTQADWDKAEALMKERLA